LGSQAYLGSVFDVGPILNRNRTRAFAARLRADLCGVPVAGANDSHLILAVICFALWADLTAGLRWRPAAYSLWPSRRPPPPLPPNVSPVAIVRRSSIY
jgi:hypothetical protein